MSTALDGEVIPPTARRMHDDGRGPRPAAPSFRLRLSTALGIGTVVCLAGLGGAYAIASHIAGDATTTALAGLQRDVGTLKSGIEALRPPADASRQDESLRALKKSVDVLKAELDAQRSNYASALSQLNGKLDKPDHDPSSKLADIVARLDKLDRDPTPKLSEITARLDRIERQVSSPATTGSITAQGKSNQTVAPQAINASGSAMPKPATLGNWVVRDVYDGIALIEGRTGGMREVTAGEYLPGAGEVRSIERRGRAWIVVTSRGIIDTDTW